MFTKAQPEPTHLEEVIDRLLTQLQELDPASDEFSRIVDQLDKLTKMLPKKEASVKPEALINVFGNLAGILAILSYERTHVITSKAIGFVLKSRV